LATIYKLEVKCVSAFCMYSNNIIEDIITKVLTEWKDKHSQLGLESIEVKSVE